MRTGLHVYRVFEPNHVPPDAAAGLDFSAFAAFRAEVREARPFDGAAAPRINRGEAFFRDAADCVRRRSFVVPNPCGPGLLSTTDVVVRPSLPWTTVPLYVYVFPAPEPFYVIKRGLSWCTDLGLVFPERRLFASFQPQDRWMAQDTADVESVLAWLAARDRSVAVSAAHSRPRHDGPWILLTSEHFAHHLWNELSVVEGLVSEGLHAGVGLLVNRQPVAPLIDLFPELAPTQIQVIDGPPDAPMEAARRRGLFVAPAGRRHLPGGLVDRLMRVARATHPEAVAESATWRARHRLILWVTIRLDVRTATNLVAALRHALAALCGRETSVGLIVDGFTRPDGVDADWNGEIIARERQAAAELVASAGVADHVVLIGRSTSEAFVWAAAADYYICPYGSAQHKVAWINPVPGLVHAGENKRPVASVEAGFHARQTGALPTFFFSAVTRRDIAPDPRQDLWSYDLDIEAFTQAVLDDIDSRVPRRSTSPP